MRSLTHRRRTVRVRYTDRRTGPRAIRKDRVYMDTYGLLGDLIVGYNYAQAHYGVDERWTLVGVLSLAGVAMAHLASVQDPMQHRFLPCAEISAVYTAPPEKATWQTMFSHRETFARMLRSTKVQLPEEGCEYRTWWDRDSKVALRDVPGTLMFVLNRGSGKSPLPAPSGSVPQGTMCDAYVYAGESVVMNAHGMWISLDTHALVGDPATTGTIMCHNTDWAPWYADKARDRILPIYLQLVACTCSEDYSEWRSMKLKDPAYAQTLMFGGKRR